MSASSSSHVSLGECVTFRHLDGLLCAAADQTLCEVAHAPTSKAAAVFRIAPMQDYAASGKATFHRNTSNPQSQPAPQQPPQQQQQQHRSFVYGQIVQLIHVQSGKFLLGSASAPTSAGAAQSAYALLDSGGDARCYWKLGIPLAMRTARRIGDRVHSGDEALLEHAASGMFVHASPFVTSDEGEQRALLSASPDSTFVVHRAGRTTAHRSLAPRDAVRLVRRDGRFLVACCQSRSVWFLRVLDDEGAPESAAAIWIVEAPRALAHDVPCSFRLFGTRLYLAHSGVADAPLTLADEPTLFAAMVERRSKAAGPILFDAPFHVRHVASQLLLRCADGTSDLSDAQLDDAFATSELFFADAKQQQVWRATMSRRTSAENTCVVQSVAVADLRRHAVVHRAAAVFERYTKKLRQVNGAVSQIAESVTDAVADAVAQLSAHCVGQLAFEDDAAELDDRAAALLFGGTPDAKSPGRFVIGGAATTFAQRSALPVCAANQDAIGTSALVAQLVDMLTLPFPNMAEFGKRIRMFDFDEVQVILRHVYELLALLVRHNARSARLLAPHVGTMLQQLGHSLGVAGVVSSVLLQTPCTLTAANVDAVLALTRERRDARHTDVLSAAVRSDEYTIGTNRVLVERALFGERWRDLLPAFELRDGGLVFVRDDAKLDWLRISTLSRARGVQWRVDALTSMLRLFAVACAPRASSCAARVAQLLPQPLMLAAVRDDQIAASMRAALVAVARALYVDAAPNRSVLSLAALHALCPHTDDAAGLLDVAASTHVYSVEPADDAYDELLLSVNAEHETRDTTPVLRERFGAPSSFAEFALMIVCDLDQLRPQTAEADDLLLFVENVRLLHDCVRTGLLRRQRALLVAHLLPRLLEILDISEAKLLKEDEDTSGSERVVLSRRAESVAPPAQPLVALLCQIKLEVVLLVELLHALEAHHALFFAVRTWRQTKREPSAPPAADGADSDVERRAVDSRRDVSLRLMQNACDKDSCSKAHFVDELHAAVDLAALADSGDEHVVQRRCRVVSGVLAHSWTPLTVAAMRLLEDMQVTRSPRFAVARLAAVLQMSSGAAQARMYVTVTDSVRKLELALPLVCECAVLDTAAAASPPQRAALKQCEAALDELAVMCRRTGGGPAQRMLAAVNAHVEALLLARLCVDAPDAVGLDAIGAAALRFLAAFATKCAPNQALLQPYIDYLLHAMTKRPALSRPIAQVMHETFHGNLALCAALSMATIEAFVALLERTNDVAYLRFLAQIMSPDRRPVLQTQRRVLCALTRSSSPLAARLAAVLHPDDVPARCESLLAALSAKPISGLHSLALRASSRRDDDDADDDAAPAKRAKAKVKTSKRKKKVVVESAPAPAPAPPPTDAQCNTLDSVQPTDSIEFLIATLETVARACERNPANARRARALLSDQFLIELLSGVSHRLVPSEEGEEHARLASTIGRTAAKVAVLAAPASEFAPPLLALPLANAVVRLLNVVWLAPLSLVVEASDGAGENLARDAWFSSAALWRALANFGSVARRRARHRMKKAGAAIQFAGVAFDSGDERADEFVFDGLVPFVANLFTSVYAAGAASEQQRSIAEGLGQALYNLGFSDINDATRLLSLAEALRSLCTAGVLSGQQAKKMYQKQTDQAANLHATGAAASSTAQRMLAVTPLRGDKWRSLNASVFHNIVAAFGAPLELLDRLSVLRFYVGAASGVLRHWTPTSLALSCMRCLYAHARSVLQCDIDDAGALVPLPAPPTPSGAAPPPPPPPPPPMRRGTLVAPPRTRAAALSSSATVPAVAARLSGGAQQEWFRRRRWLAFQPRFPRGPLALMSFMSFARRDCVPMFYEGVRLAALLLATDVDGAVSETIMQWFYARSDEPFFQDAFAALRRDSARLRSALADEGGGERHQQAHQAPVGDAVVSGGALSLEDEIELADDSTEHARQDGAHYHRDADEAVMLLFSIIELLCLSNRAQAYKNYMRSQGDNYRSYDLVTESARYMKHVGRVVQSHMRLATRVVVALDALVSDCIVNQEIVLRSKIWSVINQVLLVSAEDFGAGAKARDWLDLQLAMLQLITTLLRNHHDAGDAAHQLLLRLEPETLLAQTGVLERISGRQYARTALKCAAPSSSPDAPLRDRRIRLASRAFQCASTLVERAESHAIVAADDSAAAAAAVVAASMGPGDADASLSTAAAAAAAGGGSGGSDFFAEINSKYRNTLEEMSRHCSQRISSVEVLLANGRLERVYFPVPLECQAVHGGGEQALMTSLIDFMVARNINWSNPTDKVTSYVGWCEEQLVRLDTAAQLLRDTRWRRAVADRRKLWLDMTMVLSIVLNVMVLALGNDTFLNRAATTPADRAYGGTVALAVVGAVHVATSLLLALSYFLRLGPLTNYRRWRSNYVAPAHDKQSSYLLAAERSRARYLREATQTNRGKFWLRSVYHYLTDWESIFHIIYAALSLLGVAMSSFLFAAHLFQIVLRFDQLRTIVRAIYNISTRLLLTLLLAVICIYSLAIIAFMTMQSVFDEAGGIVCATLFQCFLSSIHYGVQLLGGLVQVEVHPPDWSNGGVAVGIVLYQLFFFVIIGVFIINILLALIVDEFGNLRNQRNVANTERYTRCLVCSIERETFQRNGVDFGHHIRVEHNIVHYLYLFAHLKYTDVLEYGATERYIYERTLEEAYLKFFPIGRALSLDGMLNEKRAADDDDETAARAARHRTRAAESAVDADDDDGAAAGGGGGGGGGGGDAANVDTHSDSDSERGGDDGGDGGTERKNDDDVVVAPPPRADSRVEALLEQLLTRIASLEAALAVRPPEVAAAAAAAAVEAPAPAPVVETPVPASEPEPAVSAPVASEPVAAADDDEETNSDDMIAALLASRPAAKNPYLDSDEDD